MGLRLDIVTGAQSKDSISSGELICAESHTTWLGIFLIHDHVRMGSCPTCVQVCQSDRLVLEALAALD